jgi:hypothetical protein
MLEIFTVTVTAILLFLSKGLRIKIDIENYEWLRNLLTIIEVLFPVVFVLSLNSWLFKEREPFILYLLFSMAIAIVFFKVGYFFLHKLVKKIEKFKVEQ